MGVRDGILRLSSPIYPAQTRSGVTVVLDSRWRVLLPYGIRVHTGMELGIRLMVLAIPIEGIAAAVPVSRVVSAFLGSS
jgi:bifunctional DNA-binding transcriptional regulator/antitoxin component of YhaV-PrlF toxin-antitoxin module